ncbi:MAG: mechanosensitive ion channel [Candidatus Amulumruptor caecigallinarius]|nr:mechanosensitive ion channel [Candidatus Amulumruptor caecigallinarius]
MLQNDNNIPAVPMPEVPDTESFWKGLEGLSFNEALSTIANALVSFAFRVVVAAAVFYLGKFIISKIYKLVKNIMTSREMDASLTTFVLSLTRITLYFILAITVIGILGVETSSFIAIFASAGVALGMALSGTLQNFAGGVLILLLKPYKVGDFIEVQGFTGTVKSIQLFNTVINTVDNKAIILPNGALSTSSVNNYSLEANRRVEWTIALSYGTDAAAAKFAIMDMLASDERVIKDNQDNSRAPFVGLKDLADSSIVFVVRAWTQSVNYWPLYFEMNERFYTELPGKGFSFPFPQLDVHLERAD